MTCLALRDLFIPTYVITFYYRLGQYHPPPDVVACIVVAQSDVKCVCACERCDASTTASLHYTAADAYWCFGDRVGSSTAGCRSPAAVARSSCSTPLSSLSPIQLREGLNCNVAINIPVQKTPETLQSSILLSRTRNNTMLIALVNPSNG